MYEMNFKVLFIILAYALSMQGATRMAKETVSVGEQQSVALPDSILRILTSNALLIDSLEKQNSALKDLLKGSQKEADNRQMEISILKDKIIELEETKIKRIEASNDSLQRWLVTVASNFLYIPYEGYSIEKIAIPAFLATKGTPAYQRSVDKLPLLQNYKDDMSSLIGFLRSSEEEYAWCVGEKMRADKANEQLDKLSLLPMYSRYSTYADWKNTFLGKEIISIQKLLKFPAKETPEQLSTIRKKLEKILNNE